MSGYSTLYPWKKNFASWIIGTKIYFSIPFTWNIPEAIQAMNVSKKRGFKCIVGGPGAYLMPEQFEGIAALEYETIIEPLLFHNPLATFTSRGCLRKCPFCSVPKTEGGLRDVTRYYARLNYLGHIPFEQYRDRENQERLF